MLVFRTCRMAIDNRRQEWDWFPRSLISDFWPPSWERINMCCLKVIQFTTICYCSPRKLTQRQSHFSGTGTQAAICKKHSQNKENPRKTPGPLVTKDWLSFALLPFAFLLRQTSQLSAGPENSLYIPVICLHDFIPPPLTLPWGFLFFRLLLSCFFPVLVPIAKCLGHQRLAVHQTQREDAGSRQLAIKNIKKQLWIASWSS